MFIITIILLLVIIVSLITLCVLISRKKDTHTVERIVEKVVEVPVTSTASSTETSVEDDEEDDIDLEVDDDDEDETLTEVQPDVMVAVESEQPEMVTSYIYSFRAKLIVSNDEVKDRYFGLIDAINSYKKVKISESFKRLRVYSGRTTYAQLVFVGKTLCLAMNLNYDDFKDKYHVLDVSDKKKFAETPVMIKLTSTRKVKQAKELLEVLFEGFKRVEVESSKEKIPTLGLKALMNRGLVKSRLTKKRF
jgi:c-di-AMP phosphodiesterase-like protein